MKAVEATLARIAGKPMKVEVARDAKPAAGGGKKSGRSPLDKFRAVTCEEL